MRVARTLWLCALVVPQRVGVALLRRPSRSFRFAVTVRGASFCRAVAAVHVALLGCCGALSCARVVHASGRAARSSTSSARGASIAAPAVLVVDPWRALADHARHAADDRSIPARARLTTPRQERRSIPARAGQSGSGRHALSKFLLWRLGCFVTARSPLLVLTVCAGIAKSRYVAFSAQFTTPAQAHQRRASA